MTDATAEDAAPAARPATEDTARAGSTVAGTAVAGTAVPSPAVSTAARNEIAAPEDGRFVFLTQNATAEEVGAVTAVLQGALDEIAGDAVVQPPAVSAWQRSQRAVRGPLTRGTGAWRSFSG